MASHPAGAAAVGRAPVHPLMQRFAALHDDARREHPPPGVHEARRRPGTNGDDVREEVRRHRPAALIREVKVACMRWENDARDMPAVGVM